MNEWGVTTVIINRRHGACGRCADFVGMVFIDDVYAGGKPTDYDGKYPLLSDAIKSGLFHPRCKDSSSPYMEGISTPPDREVLPKKAQEDLNEIERAEQKEQYGRRMEKMYKRLGKYALDSDNKKLYQGRASQWSEYTAKWHDYHEKQLAKAEKSGIIVSKVISMGLSLEIDRFTPCLLNRATGEIVDTQYSVAKQEELTGLKKQGWKFNWRSKDLQKSKIYKLTLVNDSELQGLIAVTEYPVDSAVYINIAESAPLNMGKDKKYEGVGGHLFAIAAQESIEKGYGGFLFLDAKNKKLVNYYHEKFGAVLLGMPHPYRMFIDEQHAQKLLKIYTLKGES